MKTLKNKKGFTLTELIIVIVIIGILAAVLIPSLTGYINKAKKSAAEQDAMTIHAQYLATVENEQYAEMAVLNYVVKTGKFFVLIEQGKMAGSYEKMADVGVKKPTSYFTPEEIANTYDTGATGDKRYIYLEDGATYTKAPTSATDKVFEAEYVEIPRA